MESAANLNRQKINFLGISLGDQQVMERSFFRLSKSLKFKILASVVDMLQHMLGLLQTSRLEVPGGWKVCYPEQTTTTLFAI